MLSKNVVISSSADRSVRIWSLINPCDKGVVFTGHRGTVISLERISDQELASGGRDGFIILWSVLKPSKFFVLRGHRDWVSGLKYFPKNNLLASVSWDSSFRMWSLQSRQELKSYRQFSYRKSITSFLYSHNRTFLLALLGFGISIVDTFRKKTKYTFRQASGIVRQMAWIDKPNTTQAKSTRRFAVASERNMIQIFDIKTKTLLRKLRGGHSRGINAILCVNGRFLVSGGEDKSLVIWSLEKFRVIGRVENAHSDSVESLALCRGNIVSSGHDQSVKVWRSRFFFFEGRGFKRNLKLAVDNEKFCDCVVYCEM